MSLRGAAAITGFAELPTRRAYPGRSMLGLLADAARMAMEDAHVRKEQVDGIVTEGGLVYPLGVAEYLGMTPRYAAGATMMGASGGVAVATAAAAIHAGLANTVLVAIAQGREPEAGAGPNQPPSNATEFDGIFGGSAGAGTGYAMMYTRHMHQYGTTQEQLAHVAANQRFNTLLNPNSAFQGQPITVEDVMKSRYINYPLRLLESVMPCAGGAALIITRADLAKSTTSNKPVYLLGAGVGLDSNTGWKHEDITVTPVIRSAPTALGMSGYSIRDMQFFEFYDCYTILVSCCLEDAGLVKKGEIGPFFASTDTTYKGTIPINTDGGQLSCGQPGLAGGFRHIIEATRQIMGRAGPRQVARNTIAMTNG